MPMLSNRKFCTLSGLSEAKVLMRKLPEEVRDGYTLAAWKTAIQIVARAKSKVPTRKGAKGGYAGGGLRSRLDFSVDQRSGEVRVGIARGVIVVGRNGKNTLITRQRYGQRDRLVKSGPRKGQYVKTGYKMLLRVEERRKLRAIGSRIIQPTRYGHLVEYGHVGKRGPAGKTPYMGVSVEESRDYFLEQMRDAAKRTESNLAAIGLRHL